MSGYVNGVFSQALEAEWPERERCNCGQAFATNGVCGKWGCQPAQLHARDELAKRFLEIREKGQDA